MIQDLFTNSALEEIKSEIIRYEGVEVFFIGKKENGTDRITSVIPCSWGNDDAVPVVFEQAYKGDYLIHNHPSGNLKPSDNDISLSSHFGNQGIGFLIVNNDVTEYRTVVPSVNVTEISLLKPGELSEILSPGGEISKLHNDYEYRIGQIEMLVGISETFNSDSVAIIEAGTGTGKSLAYLIPSIFWAIKNKEKIVISTNTINLQEQLIQKDIPFIKKALNIDFKSVLVKGRNNYVCLRKVAQLVTGEELFEDEILEFRNAIIEWADVAKTGTKDELGFIPSPSLWEQIISESETCIKNKCPHFKNCFFFKARKEMGAANILIVNHHILCSDISIRKAKEDYTQTALLPVYTKVIIDEAHNIEDAVSSFFGTRITRFGLIKSISRIYKKNKKNPSGVLVYLEKKIRDISVKYQSENKFQQCIEDIYTVKGIMENMTEPVNAFFNNTIEFVMKKLKNIISSQIRLTYHAHQDDEYKHLTRSAKSLAGVLHGLAGAIARLHTKLKKLEYHYREDMAGEILEIGNFAEKINNKANEIENILACKEKESVYWLDFKVKRDKNFTVTLNSCPVEVGDLMAEYLFSPINSVVLTSATLSAGDSFEFYKNRTGLNKITVKQVNEKILTSHFDYTEQAVLCIPSDMPEPNAYEFSEHFCNYSKDILLVTNGATFFLCTSFKQIRTLKSFILNDPDLSHLNVFAQGDSDRSVLLKNFKLRQNSILIGTDSFWEGVDVPGDDLKCVVIVKLPFKVPSEPIYQARAERIEEQGFSSFFNYALPLSVIRFKQGFGRLIRSTYDEGVVICLDKRLATKSYGRHFIESLPSLPVVHGNKEDVLYNVEKFFR